MPATCRSGRNHLGTKIFLPFHPNGMKFVSVDASGNETDSWTVFSVGGGALAEENDGASSVNTLISTL